MKKWTIEETKHGFVVICFTPAGDGFIGRSIHEQARFDTMRDAVTYAKRRYARNEVQHA